MGTVAVLCPGPSLAEYERAGAETFSAVVAVNRAGLKFPCDAWACLDWKGAASDGAATGYAAWRWQFPRQWEAGTEWITLAETEQSARRGNVGWAGAVSHCNPIAELFIPHSPALAPPAVYTPYSILAATYWACLRPGGVRKVLVFGADWSGVEDWDGAKPGPARNLERWERERKLFGHLQKWAARRGVMVWRVAG